MNRSESILKLAPALLKVQREMGDAKKGTSNTYFKSSYADLNSVRETALPVLNANGIVCLQPTVEANCKNFVETVLIHESGEWMSSLTQIVNIKGDAQAEGSGISYARRYGLQSLLNIGAVDDDAERAVGRSNSPQVALKTPESAQATTEAKKGPGRPAKASAANPVSTSVTASNQVQQQKAQETYSTPVTKLPTKVANGYSGNSTNNQIVNEDEW